MSIEYCTHGILVFVAPSHSVCEIGSRGERYDLCWNAEIGCSNQTFDVGFV